MRNDILLSVIVPVYNSEKYLQRCLDSIIQQKYEELEIILVDDGSTDVSAQICDEYAKRDCRVKVFHKQNGGAGSARKEGIRHARGNYITCVDSDDWIEDYSYDDLMEIANRYNPDMIACSFIKEFGNFHTVREDYPNEGYYSKNQFHEIIKKAGDEEDFFCEVINGSLCCKIFRRGLFDEFQMSVPDEIKMGEDVAVILPLIFHIDSVYVSKKAYYHYCQNKTSTTWSWKTGEFDRLKIMVHYLKQRICQGNATQERLMLQSIYFAMMEVLYDVPAHYFQCGISFLPTIKKENNIIIYGKGSFATNLIQIIKHYSLCNVVLNVDSSDANVLFAMESNKYDYVIISILDCMIVNKVRTFLKENGIKKEKIVVVDKKDLTEENLPIELELS